MSITQATDDEKLIWSITSGTVLKCVKDLVMEDGGEVAFKAGLAYRVTSMHPIADPPYVKLTDEQGCSHGLEAVDIRNYFSR